jgi:hypothetical protein
MDRDVDAAKADDATIEAVGVPDPIEAPGTAPAGEFRMDVLTIGIVVVGAIIVQNIWLRRRADNANSK